ncbi:MAG: Ig-like domain-containing protein [Bacteroidaceae bacterium]|nr:Ig-like domain-containing protein [Bacteroidaceae bacterium]
MKKKMLQILMLFSAFFLTTNVFGQKEFVLRLNNGNTLTSSTNSTLSCTSSDKQVWTIEVSSENANLMIVSTIINNATYYLHFNATSKVFEYSSTATPVYVYKENGESGSSQATTSNIVTNTNFDSSAKYYFVAQSDSKYYIFRYNYNSDNKVSSKEMNSTSSTDYSYINTSKTPPTIAINPNRFNNYQITFEDAGSTPEPEPLTDCQYYITAGNKYLTSSSNTAVALNSTKKQGWEIVSTNTKGLYKIKTTHNSTAVDLYLNSSKKFALESSKVNDLTSTTQYNCYLYKVSSDNKTATLETDGITSGANYVITILQKSGGDYYILHSDLTASDIKTSSAYPKWGSKDLIGGSTIQLSNSSTTSYNFKFEIVPVTYYGQLSVTSNNSDYGTVSVSPSKQGSTTVWEGSSESTKTAATQELTLTATPTGKCTFMGWSNDGGETIIKNSNVPSYTYKFNYSSTTQNNPTKETLTAVFVPATYYGKLTVAANDGNFGTVSVNPVNPGSTTVWSGSEVTTAEKGSMKLTITATPNTGYQFKEWQKGGVAISGATAECNYTFEFTSTTQDTPTEETLTAVFEAIPVTGVSLNKNETTIEKGKTETLTATVTPNDALNPNVTWSSSNTNVATVNEDGEVTAVDGGEAIITVTTVDGSKTATCTVTVTVPVTEVTLNMNETKVKVGETVTLIATVLPKNATNQNVSWSTSDESVAKVENGKVTAVATGNATIKVTTEDGKLTAECIVNVIESEESWDDIVVSTIPMSTEGGTEAANATVIVGEKSYPAIKAGTEDTPGKVVIKVPAGITKVRVHLNGWKNETPKVSITTTSDSEEYTLKADNGVVGDENNTFTLQNHPYDNCYTIILAQNVDVKSNGLRKSADDGQTEITIEATGEGGGRFVMYGITGDEYTREVNTSEFVYGTICLPSYGEVTTEGDVQFFSIHHKSDSQYDIEIGDGFKTPRYVTLQEVEAENLVSGTPYIYKATDTFTVKLPETNIVDQPVTVTGLVGTFNEIKYLSQHNYIIYNNLLYVVNSNNVIIDPLRAYIDLTNVPTESEVLNPTPGVKMFNFFYNEADGIMNIYDNDNVNGNVNVNLNGQAVGAEYKGIVIMNGKKVLRR